MSAPFARPSSRAGTIALAIGVLGLLACLIGAFFEPRRVLESYLYAFWFWLGLSLGGMALVMVHHLTGGAWGYVIRRPLEAAAAALPALTVLVVPILIGVAELYEWPHPLTRELARLMEKKDWWLNTPWFVARAFIYFAVWNALAVLLLRWSDRQDEDADPALQQRLARLSAGGVLLLAFSVSFASVDWILSLEPEFASTVFGMLEGVGAMLAAMAFAIVAAWWLRTRAPMSEVAVPDRFQDLGSLLFMLLLSWGYLAYSQYVTVWIADLPREIVWYVPRTDTSWRRLALLLGIGHFVVPFFLLLSRALKRSARALAAVAAWLFVMHIVYVFWQVMPNVHRAGFDLAWSDFAALLGIGGVWLASVEARLFARPLVPVARARSTQVLEHG